MCEHSYVTLWMHFTSVCEDDCKHVLCVHVLFAHVHMDLGAQLMLHTLWFTYVHICVDLHKCAQGAAYMCVHA